MKKYTDAQMEEKAFQAYLRFLGTNPGVFAVAVKDYYSKFNVPEPTKSDLRNELYKLVNIEQFDESKKKRVMDVIELVLASNCEDDWTH